MKTEKVLPDLKEIEFELTTADVDIIQRFVKEIEPPNCYLEIGTKYGGSALVAAHAAKVEIYTIDPHPELYMWKGRQEESGIHFIRGLSLEVAKNWDKPIGVLFIDGNHSEAGQDFEAWEKFVIPNGIILFHDYALHSPKVIKDCNELFFTQPQYGKKYEVLFAPQLEPRRDTSIFQVRKI